MSEVTSLSSGFENTFIAADDIEFSEGKKISLWLFEFLY
jgi:hypothetical protein